MSGFDTAFRTQAMLAPYQMEAGRRENEGIRYIGEAAAQIPEQMRRQAESQARIQMWQQEQQLNQYKLQNLLALDEAGASRMQLEMQAEQVRAAKAQNDLADQRLQANTPQQDAAYMRERTESMRLQDPRYWRNPKTNAIEATPEDQLPARTQETQRFASGYGGGSKSMEDKRRDDTILGLIKEVEYMDDGPLKTKLQGYMNYLADSLPKARAGERGPPPQARPEVAAGPQPAPRPQPQQQDPWASHPRLGIFSEGGPEVRMAAQEAVQTYAALNNVSPEMAERVVSAALMDDAEGPKAMAFILKATGISSSKDFTSKQIATVLANHYKQLTTEGINRIIKWLEEDVEQTLTEEPPKTWSSHWGKWKGKSKAFVK